MEFALTPIQTSLQKIVASYCREKCSFAAREEHIRDWIVSAPRRWKDFAELGLLGVALAEDVGGSGLSVTDCSVVLQELGRSLVPEPYWACAIMSGTLLEAAAKPEQRRPLLRALISGDSIFALACEDLTTDRGAPTTARRQPSGDYLIEGGKRLVPGGPIATAFILLADVIGASGDEEGPALFVVHADATGLHRRNYRSIDGSLVGDVILHGVRVAEDMKLADGEQAVEALAKAVDAGMVAACAEAVGVSEAAMWATRNHLRARRQFDTPLSAMQALQHRMADMFVDLEQSRSLLYRALGSVAGDSRTRRYTALAAYLQICRAGDFICRSGIQLHGASGIVDELPVGHYFKRQAVIGQLFGGLDLAKEQFASLMISLAPA